MLKRLSPRERFELLVGQYGPALRAAFMEAVNDICSNIVLRRIIERLERGDIAGALDAMNLDQAAFRPLEEAIRQAFNGGGLATVEQMPTLRDPSGHQIVIRWDARNLAAEMAARPKHEAGQQHHRRSAVGHSHGAVRGSCSRRQSGQDGARHRRACKQGHRQARGWTCWTHGSAGRLCRSSAPGAALRRSCGASRSRIDARPRISQALQILLNIWQCNRVDLDVERINCFVEAFQFSASFVSSQSYHQ